MKIDLEAVPAAARQTEWADRIVRMHRLLTESSAFALHRELLARLDAHMSERIEATRHARLGRESAEGAEAAVLWRESQPGGKIDGKNESVRKAQLIVLLDEDDRYQAEAAEAEAQQRRADLAALNIELLTRRLELSKIELRVFEGLTAAFAQIVEG